MISLTESAAEKINKAVNEQEMEDKHLRVGVFPGGCGGGYQYALGFDAQGEGDSTFESQAIDNVMVWDEVYSSSQIDSLYSYPLSGPDIIEQFICQMQ